MVANKPKREEFGILQNGIKIWVGLEEINKLVNCIRKHEVRTATLETFLWCERRRYGLKYMTMMNYLCYIITIINTIIFPQEKQLN